VEVTKWLKPLSVSSVLLHPPRLRVQIVQPSIEIYKLRMPGEVPAGPIEAGEVAKTMGMVVVAAFAASAAGPWGLR
jgi:hypothetical protein